MGALAHEGMALKLLDLYCKAGGGHTAKSIEQAREAMGIDWMIWGELVEAIPPNYTKYLGDQIYKELK